MPLDLQALIIFLVIGAIAGWLAGTLVKGYGFGLLGNIVIGIIGAYIGAWLLPQLGFGIGGLLGSIVSATIGAIILLLLIGLVRKFA